MSDPNNPIRQTIELCWDKTIHSLSHPIILYLIVPIIAAIIGAIVAFWYSETRREKQKTKKAFRFLWQSSKKLKYKDLSGRREIKEKHPSTQAHLQGEVDTLLETNKNILITSNSGAGKTHFTTNYLRHLDKTYILIPNADNFDTNYHSIPKPPKKARYKIILLDDFHTFFSTGTLLLVPFIKDAIEAGYKIWANTITGDEFATIEHNMSAKLLSQFTELRIQANLGREEAERIAKAEGIEKLPDSFRGNIGDIFQDLIVQKARYKSLDEISKLLLISIKQLYMLGIYRPPFKMLKENLRKLVKFYEPEISGEAITLKLGVLRAKEFILESKDQYAINFEENYLRTVVEPEMKVKDFMTKLSKVFQFNVATFTQAMQAATSYDESVKVYHSMLEENIQPNERPFNVLIGKSGDSDIGLTWLSEMDKFHLKPDGYTLIALLRNTKSDTEKIERVKTDMQRRGMSIEQPIDNMFEARRIQSNVETYNNLMNISGNYDKAFMLLREMIKVEIQPDVISYSTMIKLSNDFEKGMRLFKEMINEKIKPDLVVFNTLIYITDSLNKGLEILNDMKKYELSPDIYTLNTLLRLPDNFEEGESLYRNIIVYGIEPDNITLRTLFALPGDINRKLKLFEEMKNEGLKPDTSTYAFIISLSDDLEKGMKLLEQMKKERVKRDASVYGTLIHLSKDFNKGKELFDRMISDDITPDLKAYATLFFLSKNYNEARAVLDQMIENELEIDVRFYNRLIKLSNDPEKGWELLNEMKHRGLEPNVWTFNILIWLYKDNYQIARAILDEAMTDAEVKPNVVTYTQLMNISRNFQIASALLEEMVENGIQPNDRTLHVLKVLKN